MPTEVTIVVGAGGHSKVVVDALLRSGMSREALYVVDRDPSRIGKDILGIAIRADSDVTPGMFAFHVAVGDCAARQRIHEKYAALGGRPVTVIHPGATISSFSTIAGGSFIAAGAVIGPAATVADGVIVNHGAVVDHDCRLGAFSHVAPNATLGGAVTIGARALVGAGATILPGVTIGDDSVVGAGAVVLRTVEPNETYAGVPASRITRR
jgi:sugar O-acyltransferase (sialic acid O-acetyltransferase NeuD family)